MLPIFIKVHDLNIKKQIRINVDSIASYNEYEYDDAKGIKTRIETATSYFYTKESPKQIDNLIAKAIKEIICELDD